MATDGASQRLKVLVACEHFLPGFRAGGPIRTLAGLVDRLGDDISFAIVTRDHDFGHPTPFEGIPPDTWVPHGPAQVRYVSAGNRNARALRGLIRETPHDILYLNSLFAPAFSIRSLALRRARAIPRTPVVLAPRGELGAGALGLKAPKKRAYLRLARAAGLYRDVVWQASSEFEATDIRRAFGATVPLVVAPNLAPVPDTALPSRPPKQAGSLRVACVARISRMKNLTGALDALAHVRAPTTLDLFGPLEDEAYWCECEQRISALPPHVAVEYHGSLAQRAVRPTLAHHDLLLLPTLGENFGHVILEALMAGCPVLISDRTPWRDLEARGAGWDLPLDDLGAFAAVMDRCAAMAEPEHATHRAAALKLAAETLDDPVPLERHRELFELAVRRARQGRSV